MSRLPPLGMTVGGAGRSGRQTRNRPRHHPRIPILQTALHSRFEEIDSGSGEMPSSWEFQLKMAAYADAWSESSLERRATALRALGRLPSGPRGRGAPDINGINGANLIIAASVGRSYDQEELGQTITTWESMVAQDDMSDAPLLLG